MREGCKSSGASEARGSGAGEAAVRWISDRGRPTWGRGVNLIGGARLTERRGRGGRLEKA
jgi:hypothetical protein